MIQLEPEKLAALERHLEFESERREIRRSTAAWAGFNGYSLAAHHDLIVRELDAFIEDPELDVLLLHAPPGSAKSTYVSQLFPPRYFARFPDRNILFATHNVEFAQRWGRRVRNLIELQSEALGIAISPSNAASDHFTLTSGGEYMACGAGTGIAGFRADIGICDDLFGSREDAWSDTVRKKRWEWFCDDFTFRLKPGGKRILMNTRWHAEDVAGRLIELIEAGKLRGKVIDIRAEAEESDPLGRAPGAWLWDDDESYPYGQLLRQLKAQSTPMTWAAMFQQRPAPEDGDYFKAEWLRTYDIGPAREAMRIYGASDFAVTAGGGDFTVHGIVGINPEGKPFLLDLWRKQASSDEWVEAFCDLILKWKPVGWAFEKGQISAGIGPYLTRRQRERRAYCYVDHFPTRGDKATRAQSIRGYIAQHGLYLPATATWLPELRSEMLGFPAGKHDDQCDMLGLIGQLLDKMLPGTPIRPKEPAPRRDRWDKAFAEDDQMPSWKCL